MAVTQADLDRLEKALARGTLTVEVEGKRVTYRSVSELKDAIDYVQGKLEVSAAGSPPATTYASFSRE